MNVKSCWIRGLFTLCMLGCAMPMMGMLSWVPFWGRKAQPTEQAQAKPEEKKPEAVSSEPAKVVEQQPTSEVKQEPQVEQQKATLEQLGDASKVAPVEEQPLASGNASDTSMTTQLSAVDCSGVVVEQGAIGETFNVDPAISSSRSNMTVELLDASDSNPGQESVKITWGTEPEVVETQSHREYLQYINCLKHLLHKSPKDVSSVCDVIINGQNFGWFSKSNLGIKSPLWGNFYCGSVDKDVLRVLQNNFEKISHHIWVNEHDLPVVGGYMQESYAKGNASYVVVFPTKSEITKGSNGNVSMQVFSPVNRNGFASWCSAVVQMLLNNTDQAEFAKSYGYLQTIENCGFLTGLSETREGLLRRAAATFFVVHENTAIIPVAAGEEKSALIAEALQMTKTTYGDKVDQVLAVTSEKNLKYYEQLGFIKKMRLVRFDSKQQ